MGGGCYVRLPHEHPNSGENNIGHLLSIVSQALN